jgi:hypothetical protein
MHILKKFSRYFSRLPVRPGLGEISAFRSTRLGRVGPAEGDAAKKKGPDHR